tara:strand:- start:982 stop:1197 length:216 start_codon:yes stop_codon:yes gene_type:complete
MTKIQCLVCGSSNLRADRALSGRLVCNSCGTPYGVRKGRMNKINSFKTFSFNKKIWLFILLLTFAFILVII